MSYAEHGVKVDEKLWETNLVSTLPGMDNMENIEADCKKVKDLILNHPEITCLFVTEYNLALIVMQTMKNMNKRVPEDMSILCFDGPTNNMGDYFFTHIRQKEKEIGHSAVQLVLNFIKGEVEVGKTYLDSILVLGRSVKNLRDDKTNK